MFPMPSPPILVPMPMSDPECPSCGKPEHTALICAHCGYKYAPSSSFWDGLGTVLGMLAVLIAVLAVPMSLVAWSIDRQFEHTGCNSCTYIAYLHSWWLALKDVAANLW